MTANRQKPRALSGGFIAMTPILWGALGAAVLIGGLGVALKVQSARLETAKAEILTCKQAVAQLSSALTKQNDAIKELKKAQNEAEERTRAVLKRLERKAHVAAAEAQRLRSRRPETPSACPAGDAVAEIKRAIVSDGGQ